MLQFDQYGMPGQLPQEIYVWEFKLPRKILIAPYSMYSEGRVVKFISS